MQADPELQRIDSRDQLEPGSAAYYLWIIYDLSRTNHKTYWNHGAPVDSREVGSAFRNMAKQADRGLETLGFEVPERF